MRNLLFATIFCLTWVSSHAQITVVGKVRDGGSGEPISSAYVSASKTQTITNYQGVFRLTIGPADTISISHVGYETLTMKPIITRDTITIDLKHEVIHLKEVTILDYDTEEELKRKIIENPVIESEETRNARENIQKIQTLYALGFRVQMTTDEIFREHLKGPQGVNFRGLFPAIKNLLNPPASKIMNFRDQRDAAPAGLYFVPKNRQKDYAFSSDSLLTDSVNYFLTDTVQNLQKHRN